MFGLKLLAVGGMNCIFAVKDRLVTLGKEGQNTNYCLAFAVCLYLCYSIAVAFVSVCNSFNGSCILSVPLLLFQTFNFSLKVIQGAVIRSVFFC